MIYTVTVIFHHGRRFGSYFPHQFVLFLKKKKKKVTWVDIFPSRKLKSVTHKVWFFPSKKCDILKRDKEKPYRCAFTVWSNYIPNGKHVNFSTFSLLTRKPNVLLIFSCFLENLIVVSLCLSLRFFYLQTCGCVFSERALKEVKTEICHKVGEKQWWRFLKSFVVSCHSHFFLLS